MSKCKQYKIVDTYGNTHCIGYAETLAEAEQIKSKYIFSNPVCNIKLKVRQPQGGYKDLITDKEVFL